MAVEPEAELDRERAQLAGAAQSKVDLDEARQIFGDFATRDAPQDGSAGDTARFVVGHHGCGDRAERKVVGGLGQVGAPRDEIGNE